MSHWFHMIKLWMIRPTFRRSCQLLWGRTHRRTPAGLHRWGRESSPRGWRLHRGGGGSSPWCSARRCWGQAPLHRGSPGIPTPATPSPIEAGGRMWRGSKSFSPLCRLKTEKDQIREGKIYLSQTLSFMCSRTASYFACASSYISTMSSTWKCCQNIHCHNQWMATTT